MKKLIYSKEDLDLILSIELEEKRQRKIERLEKIIKEVRNILEPLISLEGTMTTKGMSKLLKILDKGEINE